MKGIQISKYVKGPDDLAVTSIPDPKPSPDQYLIAVHAAAANFFDILQIQGKYQNQPPFPWVAGAEFAGVVIAAPSNSVVRPRFAVGDRVFGASQGAFATKVCATEAQLQPVPPGWSYVEAGGLFVTAPTSYAALVVRAGIKRGDTVLVHAAAGGVGLAAVQIAKAFGATVIATAGTDEKLAVAKAFGADHAVNYSNPDWPAVVKKLTPGGRGADIVYDPVGMVDKSTKCTAWNGRILVVGFAAGSIEKLALNKVLLKNISIVGIHWGAYSINESDAIPLVWEGIRQLIERGAYRPTVFVDSKNPQRFIGLDRVPGTLKALGGRETWGKVVVEIPQEAESKL
ncbi:alcohol dehydrogenase [Ophiostoma piceae UAMH 11346]|uniref:Alcohol dehydrogenase n=1 Tax=Ophiostoma piceae (strain UAMH 11346) TaxID=1262450 RepID=S3C0F2_OPHP1|nr:alcohol dehydrogenase [Ophiostoma piceae UAMH 11346]